MKYQITCSAILCWSLSCSPSPEAAAAYENRVALEPVELDLGTITYLDEIHGVFTLVNGTDGELTIGKITTGCTCTVVAPERSTIPPRSAVDLPASLHAITHGWQEQWIRITGHIGGAGDFEVSAMLRAYVPGGVASEPPRFVLRKEDPDVRQLKVYHYASEADPEPSLLRVLEGGQLPVRWCTRSQRNLGAGEVVFVDVFEIGRLPNDAKSRGELRFVDSTDTLVVTVPYSRAN